MSGTQPEAVEITVDIRMERFEWPSNLPIPRKGDQVYHRRRGPFGSSIGDGRNYLVHDVIFFPWGRWGHSAPGIVIYLKPNDE